jgi:vacuolar-type H+-ATPase subunit H
MLVNVEYAMPSHKLNNPRHKKLDEAERLIQKLRSDSRQRLATAIHEAGHGITAALLGLPAWYDGSAIEHVKETDEWVVCFGRTQVPINCYLRLNADQMARLAVAVAEMVLLGSAPSETSECDFESFLLNGKGKASELIGIYKTAEEQMMKELHGSVNLQRAIVHEAAVFEQRIWPELAIESVKRQGKVDSTKRCK